MANKLWKWPDEWREFLAENFPGRSGAEITVLFNGKFGTNFSRDIVHGACNRYKLKNGIPRSKLNTKYTDEQLDFMREIIPGRCESKIIAAFKERFDIKINKGIVGNLKRKLGVHSGTIGGQFEKGRPPENKGKKWAEFMSEEGMAASRKTQFKKGQMPHNSTEIGTRRINKDGHVEIRMPHPVRSWKRNEKVYSRNYYEYEHRVVWEKHNGLIPKGHMVRHIDGNPANNAIENLVLVSMSENAVINRHYEFDNNADLNRSRLATAKLSSAVRRRKKTKKKKWTMSAESREKISLAKRNWWAEQKKEILK